MSVETDPRVRDLQEAFDMCIEWEARYAYVIELGNSLDAYPEDYRNDDHLVQGCMSRVWLHRMPDTGDGLMMFRADSDAAIVRGILAIILNLVNGRLAAEVSQMDLGEVFARIGLASHLTSQRANGLRSVIAMVQKIAANEDKRSV